MSSTLHHVTQTRMNNQMYRNRRRDVVSESPSLTDVQRDKVKKKLMQERRFSGVSSHVSVPGQREEAVTEELQEDGCCLDEEEDDDDDFGSSHVSGVDEPQEDIVKVLAKEITSLSLTERDQVFQEIHGVRQHPQETPQYMQDRQQAMQAAIDAIPASKRKAYNLALRMDPLYVHNAELRTRFLRCESWDAKKAAVRYLKHFQQKMDLFGRDLLCATIRQKHLSPDGRHAVMEGSSQMPVRDSTGRLVTMQFSNLNSNPSRSTKANLERIFYMTMVNTENEENQRKGSVIILGPIAKGRWKTVSWKIPRLLESLPFRREAIHLCFDPSRRIFAKIAKYACERCTRQRIRLHTGTFAETKRVLASFGIPVENLPIDDEGNAYLLPSHTQRWETRRQWEEEQDANADLHLLTSVLPPLCSNKRNQRSRKVSNRSRKVSNNLFPISSNSTDLFDAPNLDFGSGDQKSEGNNTNEKRLSPQTSKKDGKQTPNCFVDGNAFSFSCLTENDVLFGRGKRFDMHIGNVRFRKYVNERRIQYDSSCQPMKTMICRDIVGIVHSQDGRFLQFKSGKFGADSEWSEVADETARAKISNCFRSIRRKVKTEKS
jgi:hypothetical protein